MVLSESSGLLSGLHFCSSCRDEYKLRLSRDIAVGIHWVDDMLHFDILLLLSVGAEFMYPFLLYCEVYGVK